MNIEIKRGAMFFVESSTEAIKKGNFNPDKLLENCAFKIKLQPSNNNNYTQEQIDIVELQEKVEKLEARIEELENQKGQ